ncbi:MULTISPECIES: cupin domain-containing protein [unclassified Ciceribacter]|uniref:cupin domain-containing protein n=1 Tax=unclassified Ciceribacter TaxID=2628820 RepID=UPI001ABEA04E|nr:cupin domain-containing protein [Ciceribacter sp. L1K22]MBO3760749.1 cupin domain-containing protein [Ciceribacter sp. L1K22]
MNPSHASSGHSAPRTVHFLGNLLTFIAKAPDTSGSFSLAGCLTAPGAGSPYHTQQDEEGFLVVEGTYEFILDGQPRTCKAGDFVHIPPGLPHMFRNTGDAPGKLVIINLPAGPHEDFFMEVGTPVEADSTTFPPASEPDIPFVMAAAARHGIAILPPPSA